MVFYFLADLVTSISLNIIVKCSSWIIYQSANGVYYLYKKIKPAPIEIEQKPKLMNNDDYIIITREEYNKLIKNQAINEQPINEQPINEQPINV